MFFVRPRKWYPDTYELVVQKGLKEDVLHVSKSKERLDKLCDKYRDYDMKVKNMN